MVNFINEALKWKRNHKTVPIRKPRILLLIDDLTYDTETGFGSLLMKIIQRINIIMECRMKGPTK